MKYWYCGVQIKGGKPTYLYISKSKLSAGTNVVVPFGRDNAELVGKVVSCGSYDEDSLPAPLELTRRIIRTATKDEYENSFSSDGFVEVLAQDLGLMSGNTEAEEDTDDEESRDIPFVDGLIKEGIWELVLDWADEHRYSSDEKIMDKVAVCYRLCAERGMPKAALSLADIRCARRKGKRHTRADYDEALKFYKIAAEGGELEAIIKCGDWFAEGLHHAVNPSEAFRYYSLGATLFGDPACLCRLGDMYLEGKAVERNEKYAFLLYRRALEYCRENNIGGVTAGEALLRLGECYLRGIGTEVFLDGAHSLLTQASHDFFSHRNESGISDRIRKTASLLRECEAMV